MAKPRVPAALDRSRLVQPSQGQSSSSEKKYFFWRGHTRVRCGIRLKVRRVSPLTATLCVLRISVVNIAKIKAIKPNTNRYKPIFCMKTLHDIVRAGRPFLMRSQRPLCVLCDSVVNPTSLRFAIMDHSGVWRFFLWPFTFLLGTPCVPHFLLANRPLFMEYPATFYVHWHLYCDSNAV